MPERFWCSLIPFSLSSIYVFCMNTYPVYFSRNQFASEIHLHPNSLAFNCICNFTYNSCHFKFKFNSISIAIQFHLHLSFTYNLICDSFAFTCIDLNSLPSKNTNLHPKFNFCHHMDHFG